MGQFNVQMPDGSIRSVQGTTLSAAINNAGAGASAPGSSPSSGGGGGGGGGSLAPAVTAPSPAPSSGGPYYSTPNGPRTVAQMNAELAAAGWPGPPAGTAGAGATANAYAQTTGGAVTEMSGQNYGAAAQSGAGSAAAGVVQAASGTDGDVQKLITGIQQLLGAQASGNKDAIAEAIREFNATFGLDTQKFQDDIRRFNQNFEISQAGLTGQYQGAPTLVGQLQAQNIAVQNAGLTGYYVTPNGLVQGTGQGTPTLAAQNQAYTQQMGAITAAAALQANPFRQAQVIGQAGRVLQGLPTAGFQAPNMVTGVGTAGGNTQGGMGYLQQMIDDIKDPTANQTTAQSWLNATPTPNKIDSASFLRSTPTTQNLILQSMQEKYGIDPTDALTQIKNTLPQFNAPQTTGVVRRG